MFAFLVPTPEIPTLKELLLQYAPGPRLIVDSGSSAVHGVDATALGAALNRVGFLASDSGNIPPTHKAWRLAMLARPGDLVVLPLEWLHYDDPERLDLAYLEAATGVLPAYFHSLPWAERARVLANLPLGAAAHILWRNALAGTQAGPDRGAVVLGLHQMLVAGWDGGGAEPPTQLLPEAQNQTCRDYLFNPGQLQRGPNRAGLQRLFTLLQKVQAAGVTVVLVPPVVAGMGCYDHDGLVGAYWTALRDMGEAVGLPFLGDPTALWFGVEAVTNTYYHVNLAARGIATDRISGWLRSVGLGVTQDPHEGLVAALLPLEHALARDSWPNTEISEGQMVPGDAASIKVIAGWWPAEPGSRWTRGNTAALRLRVRPGARIMRLDLFPLLGEQQVEVTINGGPAVRVRVPTGGGVIEVPLPGDMAQLEVSIRGLHPSPVRSPQEVGLGGDTRTLGLMLRALEVRS